MNSIKNKNSYERYHIPNIVRTLEIFELLAQNPEGLTVMEIAKITGNTKGSTFRVIWTLDDKGYIKYLSDSNKVVLSNKLSLLGMSVANTVDIVYYAKDILKEINQEFGETVLLGSITDDASVIVSDQVVGTSSFKIMGVVGMKICINASAPGKAISAYLPEDELEKILNRMIFKKFNKATIATKRKFLKELENVRKNGYATDLGEESESIHCVGVPVLDAKNAPVASIWITAPKERVDSIGHNVIGQRLLYYSKKLSKSLAE